MQKAMVWAVTVALVWGGVLATPVIGQDVIQIDVGLDRIDDPNKGAMPIPEFEWGVPFVIEVKWVGPAEGLLLTLSDFRLVSYNPEARDALWKEDPQFDVVVSIGSGMQTQEISFRYLKENGPVVRETLTIGIVEKDPSAGESKGNLHVLFKQTVKRDGKDWFFLDPPWAGKPPTG